MYKNESLEENCRYQVKTDIIKLSQFKKEFAQN